jgi:hypothetical protein
MGDVFKGFSGPTQQSSKYKTVDPLQHYKPQQRDVESQLFGSMGQGFDVGNPYVGPNPWQTGAMDQLSQMQRAATPAFGAGLGTTQRTMGGGYLNPMESAGFANVAGDRRSMADAIFGGAMASPQMAEDPRFASAARTAQQQREQQRVGLRSAADIGEAAFRQYGAERGLQQAAMLRALGLAPDLAGALFKGGEQVRGAEQEANAAAMAASLRAQGYDQEAINQAIAYLNLASGRTLGPVLGPSPASMGRETTTSVANIAAMGCWIAAELYGTGTRRYLLARYWIFGRWQGPWATLARWAYRRYGRAVAAALRRWPWLKPVIRPLFDRAVVCGAAALGVSHG